MKFFWFEQENGIREEHYILVCGNPLSDYFLVGLTILVKFVMHTAAIVLAVRTRKVKVEAVNDAREIQITVCISTVLIILVGILLLPLANYPNVVGVGVGICIYLECITFLGFIFIPKVSWYSKISLTHCLIIYSLRSLIV